MFRNGYFLSFLLVLSTIGGIRSLKNDATPIDLMREKLLDLENKLKKELSARTGPKWVSSSEVNTDAVQDRARYLSVIKTYKNFADELERLFPSDEDDHLAALSSLWIWARTKEELNNIHGLYNVYRQMQREIVDQKSPLNIQKLINLANTILKDRVASIPPSMNLITEFIVNEKLFVSAHQEASSQICNLQQSPQQLLYNLYKTITLTEIKGYSMIQFSYVLLRIYHQGSNFWEEMQLVKQQFNSRAAETLRAVKTAMAFAPRDVWRCDPKKHVLNETYTELKQLFQGYIVNEVDMNSDNTCRETCSYYSYAKVYGCYKNQYCAQQRRCNGKIVNCEYIDSDMWICPSARANMRRYEWIQYENGKVFGKKNGSCPRATTKVDSWWRWLFWHCSYCFCYCDDHNSNSDRYFNLRKVEADIENNKVITGVKLLKKNQIIHIQIQEGELLPRGAINSSSIGWKSVDDYTVFDHNVKSGVDYHTLVWEKRAIDMDDLIPPQDHLLTGIRFRMIGTRLNLEIKITPFNFTTGKLIQPQDKSYWHSNDVTERTELPLKRPDLPIRTTLENVPDSSINQYLNFAPSDKEKDAAQSTIPFLDIQPVVPNPPVPIAGAGIFHKGRPSSGGFVALKLFTYNFGPHLQSEPAPEEPIFDSIHNEIRAV